MGIQSDYLDFSKAANDIPQKSSFQKLTFYGVGGSILTWINGWKVGNKLKTEINGCL